MAPRQSRLAKRVTEKRSTRLLKPAIGLKRPEKGDEGKHGEKIKCRTNPNDADSTTYEIPMAYFRERTPKEWLIFKKSWSGAWLDKMGLVE